MERKMFTCTVEPKWGKPTFTMRKKVENENEALKLAVMYKQLSGGFNDYSNFRYEGHILNTNGWVYLKTGKLVKGSVDSIGHVKSKKIKKPGSESRPKKFN